MDNNTKQKPNRALRLLIIAMVVLLLLTAAAYFGNRYLEKQTYRLGYASEIMLSATQYELDPYLVAAIIHCESGGRSTILSAKGAVGLMQIMPATGEWIAGKMGIDNYTEDGLLLPQVNIDFGCWYYAYLLGRYGDDEIKSLAAYNAGPGNVDKWLDNPDYSNNGVLHTIPFPETDKYIEKVKAAREKYRDLYYGELG